MSTSISPTSPQGQVPPSPTAARHALVTILVACVGVFVSYLPVVGVSTALPVIQQGLDATTTGLQWITDAFILPTAALLLTCGILGDLYGRKKMYLGGLTVFSLGCLVCLTAHSVVQVCIGQALAGVGTAALLPSTLALISHVRPEPGKRARSIALWTASLGLGLTVGPLINGVIVEHASWRWIFLPSLVVGVITVVVGAAVLPDSRAERERHLDIPGQLLAIVAITGLVYGVIEGGSAGWGSAEVVLAFVAAALGLAGFVVVELRSPCPMLDMRLFRSRAFSGAAIVMGLTLFAQVGLVFALSEYFGLVHHASTWDIGLRLIALNGFTVVLAPVIGRLMNKVSPGRVLVAGLLVAGIGALLVNTFQASTGTGTAALVIAVLGIGIALAMAPITTIAMDSLPGRLAGTAAASNSALRQIGSALGPAVFGVILTQRTLSTLPGHLAATSLNPADQGQVNGIVQHVGIQAGAFLQLKTPETTGLAQSAYGAAFTDALHTCAVVGGIGMLVAAGVALVMCTRGHAAHAEEPAAAPQTTGVAAGDAA
ncbi:DHA2 family efflux MFS transporter permease subunit [Streptomyces mangrovisoli]|uniref:Drug:proton antiporter n=1 Tax=Streptomyces mangrovisoli TaxID=1428628 RepID=A0A1J4NY42_9ACTN|nr:DHA2 family efflux MFS transporter permease subunit [Streptomyces mangrovisoli]OIJ66404.1 drug:proton antiporter [Streptomyces mangrovisoli]